MNTEVIRKDWVGSVVNERYRLVRWLGGSGESGVYLCDIDGDQEQKAAIKLLPAAADGSAAIMARWTNAAGLHYPHLIRVLDTGRGQIEDTAVLYIVSEYAGEILSEILPDRSLSANETREMMAPLLAALTYLHENGLVHGRLKPSNIMVVGDQLKLSSDNIRDAAGAVTPPQVLEIYDAPEIERGMISPASDMWSLGVTLVEALTRTPPAWNRSGQIEPLVPSSLPEPFAQIAKECLRLDPANRCTLDEVRARLDSGKTIPHRPFKPKTAGKPMSVGRFVLLAAAALIGVIAIATIYLRRAAPPAPAPNDETSAPAQTRNPSPAPAVSAPGRTPAQKTASQNGPEAAPPQLAAVPVAPWPSAPAAVKAQPPARTSSSPSSKGAVTRQVMPDVPEEATQTIQGTVIVSIMVNVDANGSVGDASIDSQGPSRYFANLALAAARHWRFTPAQTNGKSVPSVWLLRFAFRQSGTDVTSAQESP